MTRKRHTLTPEFKQEADSLVLDQDYSITQASTSLGVAGGLAGGALAGLACGLGASVFW